MHANEVGDDNTAIGLRTGTSLGYFYQTATIGANTVSNADYKIVIGNGMNTVGGSSSWQTFSDGRFKENVQSNVPGLEFITKLKPVTYRLNVFKMEEFLGVMKDFESIKKPQTKAKYYERLKEVSEKTQTGFIAQEVEATAKSIGYDFDGVHHPSSDVDNYSLSYSTFVVPLVKAVQEQQATLEKQQKLIDELLKRMEQLESKK